VTGRVGHYACLRRATASPHLGFVRHGQCPDLPWHSFLASAGRGPVLVVGHLRPMVAGFFRVDRPAPGSMPSRRRPVHAPAAVVRCADESPADEGGHGNDRRSDRGRSRGAHSPSERHQREHQRTDPRIPSRKGQECPPIRNTCGPSLIRLMTSPVLHADSASQAKCSRS